MLLIAVMQHERNVPLQKSVNEWPMLIPKRQAHQRGINLTLTKVCECLAGA
jgi:hypothetical protein